MRLDVKGFGDNTPLSHILFPRTGALTDYTTNQQSFSENTEMLQKKIKIIEI